jgi:hypothetical protein
VKATSDQNGRGGDVRDDEALGVFGQVVARQDESAVGLAVQMGRRDGHHLTLGGVAGGPCRPVQQVLPCRHDERRRYQHGGVVCRCPWGRARTGALRAP